jgi:hypothetical protein
MYFEEFIGILALVLLGMLLFILGFCLGWWLL